MMDRPCGNIMSSNHNCSHVIHRVLRQFLSDIPKADLSNVPLVHGRSEVPPITSTNSTMDLSYDYKGALLFVVGLLCMYGLCILLLIISLIRKSRTELELFDHLRDFEAMRRASQKKGVRLYHQNTLDELDEDTGDPLKTVPVGGYKSIRPDPGDDDECSDIMSVSRAKRKARKDSFTDSRMSSQETTSSFDDILSDVSNSPVRKEPHVLCMYCARKLTTPGECLHCEQERALSKSKPAANYIASPCTSIIKPNGLFKKGSYSPEREKYWVEKDPKLQNRQESNKPKIPKLIRYHSVDSTHHTPLEYDNGETDYVPSTSQRRKSFGNMRLTKQFSLDCPSDDESKSSFDRDSTQDLRKTLEDSSESHDKGSFTVNVHKLKRPTGLLGLQRSSRWLALKALYSEKGSSCLANLDENIPEEDEEEGVLTG